MTIRITHTAGIGEWACGAVVEVDDRRAARLIHDGYAVATDAKVEKPPKRKKGT